MHETPISGTTSRRSSFDSAAVWALTITAILAVVIVIPYSSVPFFPMKTFVLAMGGLVTLVLFILGRLVRGSLPLPHFPLLGALWLVPFAYLLSTLFSGVNPATALFGAGLSSDTLGLALIFALLATLAVFLLRTTKAQSIFLCGLFVAFGAVLLSQIVFLVIGASAPSLISPTSNLIGSFIEVGSFLGLGIALALLALRFLPVSGIQRFLLILGIVLGLGVLAFVNSVMAWVLLSIVAFGLFVEGIMYFSHSRVAGTPTESRPLITPLVTLAAGLLFILGSSTIGNALATTAGTAVIDARPSWQATFAVGGHTYASSPLFGSGPGTFGEEWLKHRDRAINDTIFWNIDFGSGVGQIPTSFVTTGVVGALAWLAFFALLLFFGLRALLLRLPSDPWMRFVSVSSFVGALFVFVLSILALPGLVTSLMGFLLLGLFVASVSGSEERTLVFSQNPRVGFALVFLLTLILLASIATAYVVTERHMSELSYGDAITALEGGDIEGAERAIMRTIALAPTDRAYRVVTLVNLARMSQIINNQNLAPTAAQEQFQAALNSAIAGGLEATRMEPEDYQNWAALGNVYGSLVPLKVTGAYENALDAYTRAVALAPTNPVLSLILGQLEINNGDSAAAEVHLIEAINLKRDYTQAILLFARIAVESGKAVEALQAAEAAAYFAPDDPGVLLQVGLLRSAAGDRTGAIQALARAAELNPQFANARFFLGVMYAITGDYAGALAELRAVAGFTEQNAVAVADDIKALEEGRNPFPTSRLAAFGIPYAPVDEPAPAGIEQPAP